MSLLKDDRENYKIGGLAAKELTELTSRLINKYQAKMAKGYDAVNTRVTLTTEIANDATTGVITLSLTADQTKDLDAPARYVYDVEITKTSDSTITRVIEGIITINPDVSTD